MSESVLFLLRALQYPKVQHVDMDDHVQYRALLVWLENTKIRQYPINGRSQLTSQDPGEWNSAFEQYLADLECPIKAQDKMGVMRWLLTHAVGLEYQDKSGDLNAVCSSVEVDAVPVDVWVGKEPPPFTDATLDSVQQQLQDLLELVQISSYQDLPTGLQQLQDVLELQVLPALAEMVKNAAASAAGEQQQGGSQSSTTSLQQYPLGFSTGDSTSDLAATILRMLYIKDLRTLQTLIDRTIVQVQEFTASPRTDAALGKVGR